MTLDPQVRAMLEQRAALRLPETHTLTPREARLQAEATRLHTPGEPVAKVEDRAISGPGGELPVRVYTPEGSGPFPALVYFHGGGWVVGTLDGSDVTCRALARGAGCVVVSVDYRLAPEHKFPAAAEDCYAATLDVVRHASEYGVDPNRIAVGGTSAGGNLAAVVALMARDRGTPGLTFQLLVVPVTHCSFDTASYRDNAVGYQLTRSAMEWYWKHYLSNVEEGRHPYASPLLAEDLHALPPALIMTAEYDPLRDEGEAYAARLAAAGVPVTCRRYPGMVHGFFSLAPMLDQGKKAVDEATTALRAAFALDSVLPARG